MHFKFSSLALLPGTYFTIICIKSGRKYFQRKRVPFQLSNSSQTEIYVHFVFMFGFNLANVFVFKNILPGGSGSFFFTHVVERRSGLLQRKYIKITK